MIESFIPQLIKDYDLGDTTLASGFPGTFTLPLNNELFINILEIQKGYIFKCNVAPYPKSKEEIFFTEAMMGNLFGQGTQGAILGLNLEGTFITLTLVVDYPSDYRDFKGSLDDFIVAIDFWRDEALNPTPLKA